MLRRVSILVALATALPVRAQPTPGAGEILIDATSPGAEHGDPGRIALPPEGPGREAFLKDFLRVDPRDNAVTSGGRTLSAYDFYGRIDRPDLAARADDRTRKRIWLFSGSFLVLAASIVGGAAVVSSAPNVNGPSCSGGSAATYNACIDKASERTLAGTLIIAAGVAVAAGLFTWAVMTPEMVTSREETVHLATEYNRVLARKNGAQVRLQLSPTLAPGYGGLTARLTF